MKTCASDIYGILSAVFVLLNVFSAPACAELRLNGLFRDGMVLQRNCEIPVFGQAAPGEEIRVEFAGQTKTAVAGPDGKFRLLLDPLAAGGPYEMKVTGANNILLRDVLVGEVWIASGQSNMDMQLKNCLNAKEEIAAARFPQVRQFMVKRGKAAEPSDTLSAASGPEDSGLNVWVSCSPETAGDFSGAAYFFARELNRRLGVPVGLINIAWGGTVAEAWTPRAALEGRPELRSILSDWPKYNQDEQWLIDEYKQFEAELKAAAADGLPAPVYFNQPSVLYNANISPLAPYAIRGVIWYQGEENVFRAYQYRDLFPALIASWREAWQSEFPFLFVQLPNFNTEEISWVELREAQLMTLHGTPNTGMAITMDIGEPGNVHPKNKQEVGRRLSLAARALVYGETGLEWSGPLYRSMSVEGDSVRLEFDHIGEGLVTRGNEPLSGFLIASADRQFHPARSRLEKGRVVVWSDQVKEPAAVRYGWSNNPVEANLYNRIAGQPGLPASPFRSDDWPGLTANRTWH